MKGLGKIDGVQIYGSKECKGPVMSMNFDGLKAWMRHISWKMVMKLQCAPDFIVPP